MTTMMTTAPMGRRRRKRRGHELCRVAGGAARGNGEARSSHSSDVSHHFQHCPHAPDPTLKLQAPILLPLTPHHLQRCPHAPTPHPHASTPHPHAPAPHQLCPHAPTPPPPLQARCCWAQWAAFCATLQTPTASQCSSQTTWWALGDPCQPPQPPPPMTTRRGGRGELARGMAGERGMAAAAGGWQGEGLGEGEGWRGSSLHWGRSGGASRTRASSCRGGRCHRGWSSRR